MDDKRINFNVPVEVHNGFKSWCAEQGTTMKLVLLNFINKIHKAEVLKDRKK